MILRRPHLAEDAVLIAYGVGSWDANNRYIAGPQTRTRVRVAAYPARPNRVRAALPGGARLEQQLTFCLDRTVSVGPTEGLGDLIEYRGVEYRAFAVSDYGDGTVIVNAVREDV